MKEKNPLLLPSGLYDLLPPEAHLESDATARLLASFASFGYAQVSPPLLEFESSLLKGRGETMASQTFRVMDPVSHAMMGFRPDMTLQVARIATTRMKDAARPLRLCYSGPILRVKPEALMNERQLLQAGIELIGIDSWQADAEVMIVAAESLLALGITAISLDLHLSGILSELCPEADGNDALRQRIRDALKRREAAALMELPLENKTMLISLMQAAGPAGKALETLARLKLAQTETLKDVIARIQQHCPNVTLTIDPLEHGGFDYHQGIGFSIFARNLRHELGRGGRYMAAKDSATGFTLYVTYLLPLLKRPQEDKRVLIPFDMDPMEARKLRGQGWITISAMSRDLAKEAKQLGITSVWNKGEMGKF